MTNVSKALKWWDKLSDFDKNTLSRKYFYIPDEKDLSSDEVLTIFIDESKAGMVATQHHVPDGQYMFSEETVKSICKMFVPENSTINNLQEVIDSFKASQFQHPVPDEAGIKEKIKEYLFNTAVHGVNIDADYLKQTISFLESLPTSVPDEAGEVQRPSIKDYFGKDADLKTVMAIYDSQPELFNYAQALDRYIDDCISPAPPSGEDAGKGWISVETLPEKEGNDYLVTDGGACMVMCFKNGAFNNYDKIDWWNPEEVTHWQPLPAPPNVKQ